MISTLTTLFLALIYMSNESLAKQRVIAIGQVICNGKPYDGAIVKLYDKDVLIDSLMARNQTLKDGSFYLDGTATDILSKIDPTLYIYHKCNKGSLSCKREWIFSIPKDYVYDEKDKKIQPVDVGRWELAVTPKSETFKCLPAKKMVAA
uniref:Uncharacterized protein n=1 Tax=Romanomermis culicivorax TaxID=13658 RepID=A0A915JXD0_ROMCU